MTGESRIGYAVLAHGEPGNLARLLGHLIASGGLVAVHLDAKSGPALRAAVVERLGAAAAEIIWADPVAVNWGGYSMIEATLRCVAGLLGASPTLSHIHLMSGSDYPIRPLSAFAAFLARNPGISFIESHDAAEFSWVTGGLSTERYQYRHFFNFRTHRKLFDINWKLQRAMGLKVRPRADIPIRFGSQWCTLTAGAWKAVLDLARRDDIQRFFRYSWIPDEMLVQTLLAVAGEPVSSRHLTFYEFSDYGLPVVFYNGQAPFLLRQPFFFARKLSAAAAGLRDDLDAELARSEPSSVFADAEMGIATTEHLTFRYANRFPAPEKRTPGVPGYARLADLNWNKRPYVVFYAAMPEAFEGLEANIQFIPALHLHGRLFAADAIHFLGNAPAVAGYRRDDTALRDHSPQNFLCDLLQSRPGVIQAFLLPEADALAIGDATRRDPHAIRLLVKPPTSGAGAASSAELLKHQAMKRQLIKWHINVHEVDRAIPGWQAAVQDYIVSESTRIAALDKR